MNRRSIDGLAIYNGFLSGYRHMAGFREYMNDINVFPVADGDTGNNLVRTFRSIVSGLRPSRSASEVLSRIGALSLRGARGNSGSIISQYLNGIAEHAADKPSLSVTDFGRTAHDSVDFAYQAMENPTEGTILTVIRSWANTIHTESLHEISMNELLARGLKAARTALNHTTEQLDVLKKANVPDAGAWGFVRFLEGISALERTGPVPLSFRKSLAEEEVPILSAANHTRHRHIHEEPSYRYCTELYMERVTAPADAIRRQLKGLGDSLIISSGGNCARIHIHTGRPADVVQRSRRFGQVREQKVDDMVRQARARQAPPGRIAVLTDSIADIPRSVQDELDIHVLNLNLTWGDEEFLDRLTITPDEFYRQQLIRRDFPGSAAPDAERVQGLYRFLLEAYDGVIVLPVARALSGTWNLMQLAAEAFNGQRTRIQVVDTCLNSAAQGLLVAEIGRMAVMGASLDDLVRRAVELKKRIRIYVSVSTFKFMVRGGRLSPIKGMLATLMNMKPIVSLDEKGQGVAFEKAFSRKGLLKKIERIIRDTVSGPGIERFVVVHAAAAEGARNFSRIVEHVTGLEADYICSISPIVGMHSGKGAIAIGLIEGE